MTLPTNMQDKISLAVVTIQEGNISGIHRILNQIHDPAELREVRTGVLSSLKKFGDISHEGLDLDQDVDSDPEIRKILENLAMFIASSEEALPHLVRKALYLIQTGEHLQLFEMLKSHKFLLVNDIIELALETYNSIDSRDVSPILKALTIANTTQDLDLKKTYLVTCAYLESTNARSSYQ